MRVGIDGSNLRQGGGVTHLVQMLEAADPPAEGITRVTVWGSRRLLDELPDRPWLARVHDEALERNGLSRMLWQQRRLASIAGGAADLLFSPGGTYLGSFHPFVTMFRNMLPFAAPERRSYGLSPMRLKLEILRRAQGATFRRADGVIFLTDHARAHILESGITVKGRQAVIPHGLDPRFFGRPKPQPACEQFSAERPYRWLYVSAIHQYKHPWTVAEAVAALRAEGLPLTLDIVGPPYPPAMRRLDETIRRLDPDGSFLFVTPGRSHADLPGVYHAADGFVFASTCENMPNSLLEAMAAGLPIVCSDRAPMPDILQDGGLYCDPRSPASIAAVMKQLMADAPLRARLAAAAQARAREYSWATCAQRTFEFLARIAT
jgi:glycosyltransferase involved in cell wall biosynthesis